MTKDATNYGEIRERICEVTPDRCKPCYRPRMTAGYLADQVIADQITIEEAQSHHKDEYENDCKYGAIDVAGCFGSVACRYAVLCEFPPTKPWFSPLI